MRFKSINRNFSLKDCMAGNACHTVSNHAARFIFMGNGTAPLVMMIGEYDLENYTVDGRHLFDPRLDLVMPDSVDVNVISPTYPMRYEQIEAKLQNGQMEDIRKVHSTYLLY